MIASIDMRVEIQFTLYYYYYYYYYHRNQDV